MKYFVIKAESVKLSIPTYSYKALILRDDASVNYLKDNVPGN